MAFIGLCEKRLEDLEVRRSKKHFKENKTLFENLILLWGNKKDITRSDVEEYLKMTAKKSPQKANKRLRLIKALFNFGKNREWISSNPAVGIERFPITPKRRYVPPVEDVVKVLELATPEQKLYLSVVINTMGRIGAINRLKWDDIYDDYLILKTRKAKNSDLKEIKIPLNSLLKEALKQIPRNGDYVFINPVTQEPYGYRSKFLRTLCKRAEVKYFSFHCLRHWGANRLDKEGVPLTDIQKLLGHERASTTDLYLRGLSDSLKNAVEKLDINGV